MTDVVINPQAVASEKDEVYYFSQGIPGFEHFHYYYMIRDEDAPIGQLLAVDDEQTGFILISPEAMVPNYREYVKMSAETKQLLDCTCDTPDERLEIWAIITLNGSNVEKSTANLRAPILLHVEKKLGVQYIMEEEHFTAREPLVPSRSNPPEGVEK